MKMNVRIGTTLIALAVGGLLSATVLADDKELPKPAAPTPTADDAPAKVNEPAPSDAKPSAPEPTDNSAPTTPAPSAAKNAPKPQPNAPGNQPNAPGNQPNQPNATDDQPPAARDAAQPAKSGARRTDIQRNQPGAVRHQTNRAFSNDPNGRPANKQGRSAGASSRTNIGLAFGADTNGPLVVSSIGPNGHFRDLGMQQGDQLVGSGDHRFNTQADFYAWLGTVQAGQRVPLLISRNGQQQTLYWTPTEQFVQAYAEPAPAGDPIVFLGIQLDNQIPDAVVVANVQPNSPAQRAGIRAGDVIAEVNRQPVSNPDEFLDVTAQLQPGAPIDLAVSRMVHVQIASGASQSQTTGQQVVPDAPVAPAPPVVAPAPARPVPANPAPSYRRGLRRR